MIILIYILSYLLGSIPSGLILTKIFAKQDIRQQGSGNIGFSNVLRTQSKILAFFTILFDVLKTLISLFICSKFFPEINPLPIGLIIFFGHICPIFLKFKGGKGIAVLFALIIFLNPIIGLACAITWFAILKITKIAALASLITFSTALLFLIFYDFYNMHYYILLNILIFFTHRSNLIKLFNRKENKISLNNN